MSSTSPFRSTHVTALCLKHALTEATASLTVQEGLYRAYKAHLCDLSSTWDLPPTLGVVVEDLVSELRAAFGFDGATGLKIRESTLMHRQATALLERLKSLALSAEHLAEHAESPLHPNVVEE